MVTVPASLSTVTCCSFFSRSVAVPVPSAAGMTATSTRKW